ncbi:tRNA (32-2'-O)-methyltransferase regulator THADA [Bemisia tabaci]|uniref:tRNA (32-2'-O)-methyltransferase regulator THADA n=1 Tax=Bemisia tabaci TaxID=7038 RepID=UPI003B286FDB
MTDDVSLLKQLTYFKTNLEYFLNYSKFTGSEDFFQTICTVCQRCAPGNQDVHEILLHLTDLTLTLLSKRILTLNQQLIATKAFLYIQGNFVSDHESPLNLIQLVTLDEENKTFVYSLPTKLLVKLNFSGIEEIALFKVAFFYLFSNSLKEERLISLFGSRPVNCDLLSQIVNYCKVQNFLTSISFKTLVNFLSSFSCDQFHIFFSDESLLSILNLILANWENPIPGVKENNLILFRLFLSLKKDKLPELNLSKIVYEDLSWKMKAKYLMIMEILNLDKDSVLNISTHYPYLIPKLFDSMKINYLVSACTELYLFIISCIDFEQWKRTFLKQLVFVLTSEHNNESQKWNILNHWTIKTLKKFPQSVEFLLSILLDEKNSNVSSCALLAIIMCLKTLRKQGIKGYKEFNDFQKFETLVLEGLHHENERIRCESFNLLCSCTKTSIEPSEREYTLVLQFIIENVNFDSSHVRQNLLTSFVIFLDRLKNSVILKLKNPKEGKLTGSHALWFLEVLIQFLIQNLAVGSNYQRKITSLKLLKILAVKFDSSEVVSKYLADNVTLLQCLHQCIVGGTDDIIETAAQIVIFLISSKNGFAKTYQSSNSIPEQNPDLSLCCAHNEVLLKVCLLTEAANIDSKNYTEKIVLSLVQSIQDEAKTLFVDALQVASSGILLYSLKALTRLISDQETSQLYRLSPETCNEILNVLEQIVQHLVTSLTAEQTEDLDFAPSFAEMGQAIEKHIQNSDLLDASKKEENKEKILLSSAYQSLLCCIWRNLQACCELSVNLVMTYCEDLSEKEILRSGKLVSTVLLQCRHKGAIEAAGVALGRFMSFIIKMNKDTFIGG